jgi:hypothetical protein
LIIQRFPIYVNILPGVVGPSSSHHHATLYYQVHVYENVVNIFATTSSKG